MFGQHEVWFAPVVGGSRRRDYFPALDGLRAVAVLAVVLFHAGLARAQGGFLGVSLFFTLSGYLITRLLLAEHASTGRIGLAAFWGRRVRRLAPAALLCLAAVLAAAPWLVSAVEMRTLRGDVIAAASNVANWRFVTAGQSYASIFAGRPSAVLHFWSLAIEEQFYLVFPCLVALLVRWHRKAVVPLGLLALTGASLAATFASTDHDLVYYGTHTRAAELLIGALLAWVMAQPRLSRQLTRQALVLGGSLVSLTLFGVLVVLTPQSAGWLYRGGFAAVALLWCVMIVAATTAGPFAASLGIAPLAAIGRRSYGIYLFHWPVFALVTAHVLHLHGWPARTAQLVIIAAATEISYHLVERPIRERRVLASGAMMRVTAMTAIAGIIVAALVMPAQATPNSAKISMLDAPDSPVLMPHTADTAVDHSVDTAAGTGSAPAAIDSAAPSTTAAPPPMRIVVVGSAPEVAAALRTMARGVQGVQIIDAVRPGCPAVEIGDLLPPPAACGPPQPFPAADLTVIAVGAEDHRAFADRLAASRAVSLDELYRVTQQLDIAAVAAFVRGTENRDKVIVIDADDSVRPERDLLDAVLAEAAVSTTALSTMQLHAVDAAFFSSLTAPLAPSRALRVMVIGDSTSYGVASGLAASDQHIDVLWAGKRNCPLIPLDAMILIGKEYSMTECPSVQAGWPETLASFQPDVVLAVDSLPEESPQRYPGDPTWYQPGDPQYIAAHDAGMQDLLDLIAPTGAVVEIADAPLNAPDASADWTTDEQIAAWNKQLASWDAQWSVVETIGYAGLIQAAEAAAGHTLRPDGAHLDDASVTAIIGGSLAPLLVQQVKALRTRLLAQGCITTGAGGPSLSLVSCR